LTTIKQYATGIISTQEKFSSEHYYIWQPCKDST